MTVRDLIKSSLRLIGAIASGETPTSDEQADALATLNDILESWSNNGFLIYEKKREVFSLVATQQAYTFGTGGNFNSTRPVQLLEVNSTYGSVELPMKILTDAEWAAIPDKTQTAENPTHIFASGSFPLLTLSVWPIPTTTNSIVIHSLKPLTEFAAVGDTVSLPIGYSRALKYNLALELAPEYGKAIDPNVANIAVESKADLQRQNIQPVYLLPDTYGIKPRAMYDIKTGTYR
ncbi:MAG: hypothetical protein ACXVCP_00375 [Bdellovibrio sp.]